MSHPILVTGAAGGQQGSTGRHIANLLIEQGAEVRALVHKQDARSDGLREHGAEVVEGDLLDPPSVRSALQNVRTCALWYRGAFLKKALSFYRGEAGAPYFQW